MIEVSSFQRTHRADVSVSLTWGQKQIQFPKHCVLLCCLEYRMMDKSKNPVISSVSWFCSWGWKLPCDRFLVITTPSSLSHLRFEVFTMLTMNITVYLDAMPLLVDVYGRFRCRKPKLLHCHSFICYHIKDGLIGSSPLPKMSKTIYLSICLSVYLSIYLSVCGSTALYWTLAAFSVSWSLTQSVGLLEWGISLSQGRYPHTGHHKHRINPHRHPCL
jgi:hypothetical protein